MSAEPINAIITEAKHVEPFLKLPFALKNILQIPFAASTADLKNIVSSKKVPKFLHTALYYSDLASKQVGKELLSSCNQVANLIGSIWKYLHIIDPSIVVPLDVEVFDFNLLAQHDGYDVKLTARYWAQQMHTLLLEIDSVCRLAIKEQSRLVLSLFEISPQETAIFAAHVVFMHTQKLQRGISNDIRAEYIEFAKAYASLIDKLDVPALKDRLATESVLFRRLEMSLDLVDNLGWLQKMLYKHPDTTIQTWYAQFMLMGDWMNRVYLPWFKECHEYDLFSRAIVPHKGGPLERVTNALSRPALGKHDDIKVVCTALTDLFLGNDLTTDQYEQLNKMCLERSGLTLLEWAVIIDMSFIYETRESTELLGGGIDREELRRKKTVAEEALYEFLSQRDVNINPDSAIFRAFVDEVDDLTDGDFDLDALVNRRTDWFNDLDERRFRSLVRFVTNFLSARNALRKADTELREKQTNVKRVTRVLEQKIAEEERRIKSLQQTFVSDIMSRVSNKSLYPKIRAYMDWFKNEGYRMQTNDTKGFREKTERLTGLSWSIFETVIDVLELIANAERQKLELVEELKQRQTNLQRGRTVLSVFLFIMFGVIYVLVFMYLILPAYTGTPKSATATTLTNVTSAEELEKIIAAEEAKSAWTTESTSAWSWISESWLAKKLYTKLEERAERDGFARFNFSRIWNLQYWLYDFLRGAGPTDLVLLYVQVMVSMAWGLYAMTWGVSSAFGNTIVNGVFDNNASETWRIEKVRIDYEYRRNTQSIITNVAQLMNFHSENAQRTLSYVLFAARWAPVPIPAPFTQALTNHVQNYGQSSIRAVREFTGIVENNNNLEEFNRGRNARLQADQDVLSNPNIDRLAAENGEPNAEEVETLPRLPAPSDYIDE